MVVPARTGAMGNIRPDAEMKRGMSYLDVSALKKTVEGRDQAAAAGGEDMVAKVAEEDADEGEPNWVSTIQEEGADDRTRSAHRSRVAALPHRACGAAPPAHPTPTSHPTPCATVFGLFAALGNAGQRSQNVMNRNPLPRGRAVESVDWLIELFKYLPPTTGSVGVPGVRVPLTLTLRHSRPHTWYQSSRRGGVTEAAADKTESEEIVQRFAQASRESAALLGLDGQVGDTISPSRSDPRSRPAPTRTPARVRARVRASPPTTTLARHPGGHHRCLHLDCTLHGLARAN